MWKERISSKGPRQDLNPGCRSKAYMMHVHLTSKLPGWCSLVSFFHIWANRQYLTCDVISDLRLCTIKMSKHIHREWSFFFFGVILFTYCDRKSLMAIAGADWMDSSRSSRQGPLEGYSYLGRISEDGSMSMPYYIIAFTSSHLIVPSDRSL